MSGSKEAPASEYQLDIRRDASWPGTEAGSDTVTFKPAAMKAVASWLRQRAAEMSGMPQTLASTAGRTEFGPVEWAQASHLRIASTQVSGAVAQYWDQVVGNMNAAADAIDASADGLARVEATNLDMIKAQEVVLTSNSSGVQAGGR